MAVGNHETRQTMAATMAAAVGDDERVETVCHCERTGSLESGAEEWHRYDSLAALPERALAGWEELVVFTTERVYRQVGVGYGGGVTVVPRTPESLATAASAAADEPSGAACDD